MVDNGKNWILYITVPLVFIVLIICTTLIIFAYNIPKSYSLNFSISTDNNTVNALKIMDHIYSHNNSSKDSFSFLRNNSMNIFCTETNCTYFGNNTFFNNYSMFNENITLVGD